MAGVNRVTLVGHLGADPEMRYTQSGQSVCDMRLATSESFKDKDGNRREKTEWHRCVAWGRTAEVCSKYLAKGRQVYIEGRLQTRKYDDKAGITRYSTEIVVSDVQFLSGNGGNERREDGPPEEEPPLGPLGDEELPF